MIFSYEMNDLPLETGDILCMMDGAEATWHGRVWTLIGGLIPGEVDHVLMYVGPGSRFVESGPSGVITFEMPGPNWDSVSLRKQRGFLDRLHGVGYAVANRGLSLEEQVRIRRSAADYCLEQAALRKPYNFLFTHPDREDAFYCSQLMYRAYMPHGINLKVERPQILLPVKAIFPADVWRATGTRRLAASSGKR